LTVLGVALGVASVISIQIINRNALAAFAGSVQAVSGEADLTVLGNLPTFDEILLSSVLDEPGVEAAWPMQRIGVALADQPSFFLDIIGFDLFAGVRLPLGDDGRADDRSTDAVTRPGWAAVTPALATEMGWEIGDSVAVTSGTRRGWLVIGALVDFQRVNPLASRKLVVMDIAQAQHLFGTRGQITQIDVRVADDDVTDVASRLAASLGPSVQVLTPEQREQEASRLLQAFRLNLTALSFISLFVGLFLVYSSTQAALVRRRAEFGVRRSIGASRAQVLAIILGEVAVLGLLGVALGLPGGYWAATANVEVVSQTLSNLYLLNEIEAIELPAWIFLSGIGIGVGGAVAGAIRPALDMSRRDCKALLAAFSLHERAVTSAARWFALGMTLMGGSVVWFVLQGHAVRPGGFVLAAALLIGLPLMTPLLVGALSRRAQPQRFNWVYSVKSLSVRLHATAVAVAALSVAVAMLVGITLMIGSFRKTLDVWMASAVQADIYVTTPSWQGGRAGATLERGIVEQVSTLPRVRAIDRLRSFTVVSNDRRVGLAGIDFGLPIGESRFTMLSGDRDAAFLEVRRGSVLISEPLARKARLSLGDTVSITGPDGQIGLHVAGVYYDYSNEAGAIVADHATVERQFGPGEFNSIALYLEPGVDQDEVIDALRARFTGVPLLIRSNRRLREEALRIFDQTFAITRILQAMSLLVAVTGITLTLLVLARERLSELALYRALGAERPQIFRVFLGKGLAISAAGLVLGTAGGVILAMILIFLINRAYFGWTIQVHVPWLALGQEFGTIVLAATAASVYPALLASRVPATELSREDV
jgi:putative ABC transport system permease protein